MRRISAILLIGLGAFLVTAGPLLRFYVEPQLVKAPLDQDSQTISEAPGSTYLDVANLTVREGRTLVATRTVLGDVVAGDDDTAVWDIFVKVEDPAIEADNPKARVISASTDRVAFDRRTSVADNCCDENLNGAATEHEGIEYKFPFGVEKKTYQYFDTTLGRATPMEYQASETIEGVSVYRFEQRIEPEPIAELDVPGTLIGSSETSVPVERFYSNTRSVWVEPRSGVIVKGQEQQFSTLRDDTGEDVLTVTQATLTFNDETVKDQAQTAKDAASQIGMLKTLGPVLLVVIGLLLIGGGVLLTRRRAGRDETENRDLPNPRSGHNPSETRVQSG